MEARASWGRKYKMVESPFKRVSFLTKSMSYCTLEKKLGGGQQESPGPSSQQSCPEAQGLVCLCLTKTSLVAEVIHAPHII